MVENKLQAKGFLVWGACALFFLYEFSLRTIMGTYQSSLMQDLSLTSMQFSLLSTTIFLLVYGLMQIPVGIIFDNIGLKKSLIIGAACCTVSVIGFSYAHTYGMAMAFRMIMGFGASFGFIGLLISIYDWMPHKYNAIFIGLSQFIGTLGPMMVAGPLESLSATADLSWRFVFLCLGGAGLVLLVLIFFFVDNNRKQAGKCLIFYKPQKISTSISLLFSRAQPWYIAFLSASLYFTIEYLSENEARAFLAFKGISSKSAAYMITIAWIGYAVGCPLLGFLSDMFERRKLVLELSAFIAVIAILMLLYLPGILQLQTAFFILGISASGQSIGFATIAEQFKKQFVAVGFGLNNTMIAAISAVNSSVIGLLLDATKNEKCITLNHYLLVFNILIAIAVLALILAKFFIKETYCKSFVSFTIVKNRKHK